MDFTRRFHTGLKNLEALKRDGSVWKAQFPSIVVHSGPLDKEDKGGANNSRGGANEHDKIWRNNSRANVRPSGEKASLIKLKNPKSEVRFPIYAKRLMRVR